MSRGVGVVGAQVALGALGDLDGQARVDQAVHGRAEGTGARGAAHLLGEVADLPGVAGLSAHALEHLVAEAALARAARAAGAGGGLSRARRAP